MKRSEIFFNAILVPLDYLVIVFSALFAYYLRFHPLVLESYPVLYEINFQSFLKTVLIVAPFVVLIFAIEGLYSMKATRGRLREFYKILIASSSAFLIVIIVLFLNREFFSSRFIILLTWILITASAAIIRTIVRVVQGLLAVHRGIGIHRILLIGKNSISQDIKKYFNQKPSLGYKTTAVLEDFTWERLQKIKDRRGIDEIIQCDPELLKSKVNMLVRFSDIYKIDYRYIPNLFQAHATNISIRQVADFPVIELNKTPLDGWGKVLKRIFDIVFSVLFFLVFWPLFLLIAIAIKLDSPGPIFYKDYRCGYRKRKFICYKFRSLNAQLCDGEFGTQKGNQILRKLEKDQKKNTRKKSPLHKIKDDPRVTRLGKFIRRYSLDELPQFLNVLKGDMSVVGYRPHMTYEVDKFNYDQQRMFYIKPGITGLAQISGRSDLDFEEEVRLDVYYMENWSLTMDLAIIAKTPFTIFQRRRVE
ncbi:MAG: sugar transferase [Patescibacteria group bacterium]|nr:sugar transferase [Patescibacteria group bacterium]